jgi:hypothetical protein
VTDLAPPEKILDRKQFTAISRHQFALPKPVAMDKLMTATNRTKVVDICNYHFKKAI